MPPTSMCSPAHTEAESAGRVGGAGEQGRWVSPLSASRSLCATRVCGGWLPWAAVQAMARCALIRHLTQMKPSCSWRQRPGPAHHRA